MPDENHISLERVTLLLRQILLANSPELGARLKQRLTSSLVAQGLPRFDHRSLGHNSFRAFLEKTQSHWVNVIPPKDGDSDILVELRPTSAGASALAESHSQPRFRNDVWQAFTNPDVQRRRFLNRKTGQVIHFKDGDQCPEHLQWFTAPDDHVEITFIQGGRQLEWMEEFLNAVPIVGDERAAYESMKTAPYSSAMNAAFTRALGTRQDQWKEFRTSRIAQVIAEWAAANKVSAQLLRQVPEVERVRAFPSGPTLRAGASPSPATSPVRLDALKLLDILTDQEIKSIVIPVLSSALLLRSRV